MNADILVIARELLLHTQTESSSSYILLIGDALASWTGGQAIIAFCEGFGTIPALATRAARNAHLPPKAYA